MEPSGGLELRSMSYGDKITQMEVENRQFGGDSFTALLELPSNQAMELLHSATEIEVSPSGGDVLKRHRVSAYNHALLGSTLPAFPSDSALIERAAKYSVFAMDNSSEPSNSIADMMEMKVKLEPIDNGLNCELSDPSESEKSLKRKEREKKGKVSSKKSKTVANQSSEDGEKLPYVHVRARRGQATDSHSLAERARREKINARMKLLQELVPGCNKISGTALVLDEVINHVQSLQRQVEYLSMRLAAVNPRLDSSLDSLILAGVQTESVIDSNFNLANMAMPLMWPEFHVNGDQQQFQQQWNFGSLSQSMWIKEENHHNLVASENSLLSYNSSANSASLHSSQPKMEQ